MIQLITHSGTAHADDIFAYAVLSRIFKDHELIRTRDPEVIHSNDLKIVFDVGLLYDPDKNYFDHHQAEKEVRDDGVPYSSFGLIWKHFGKAYLRELDISEQNVDQVWEALDKKIVYEIDVGDNGVNVGITPHLMYMSNFYRMIENFFSEYTIQEFKEVATIVERLFINIARKEEAKLADRARVDEVLKTYDGNGTLVLDFETLSSSYISKDKSIKFIISPREDKWQLYALAESSKSFDRRKPIWSVAAGLTDEALVKATGISDLEFCHSGLFLAIGKTKESILELAKKSLEE